MNANTLLTAPVAPLLTRLFAELPRLPYGVRAMEAYEGDGVDHYGLYPDWVEDVRKVGGQQVVDDLATGAEAYLQMWQRALR